MHGKTSLSAEHYTPTITSAFSFFVAQLLFQCKDKNKRRIVLLLANFSRNIEVKKSWLKLKLKLKKCPTQYFLPSETDKLSQRSRTDLWWNYLLSEKFFFLLAFLFLFERANRFCQGRLKGFFLHIWLNRCSSDAAALASACSHRFCLLFRFPPLDLQIGSMGESFQL